MHECARVRRQDGAALVTAMLIAALAVIALAGLFDRQAVMMRQVESGQMLARARLLQDSCLTWASVALEQETGSAAAPAGGRRVLDCPRGIVEPLGQEAGADAPLAGSSETVDDLQSRFNLRNLVRGDQVVPEQLHAFERLLAVLGLDMRVARKVAQGLAQGRTPAASTLTGPELAALAPLKSVQAGRLARFLVFLPQATPLNVNSAAPEVLAAISTMSLAQARLLAASRARVPFRDTAEFTLRLGQSETLEGVAFTAQSEFFAVSARTRLGRIEVSRHMLAVRDPRTGRYAYRDPLLESDE